mgnify:CR=1 FL=1
MSKPHGIILLGANGSGKSTLGRELASVLNFAHFDVEDYYFYRTEVPYTAERPHHERNELMLSDMKKYGSYVVSGDVSGWGDEFLSAFELAVLLKTPKDIRMKRIEEREYARWGDRVLEGGDMYESQQNFRSFVANRDIAELEQRAEKYPCPVIELDSTDDMHINIAKIVEHYQRMFLCHYFEKAKGPLLSLSVLSQDEADAIQQRLVSEHKTFAAQRNERYLTRRKELELLVRDLFIEKGGKPEKDSPHYFVIGECPWLSTWYEEADFIKIPIKELDLYGDTFPSFSPHATDGMEYRNTVYTYEEVLKIIDKYGLPQDTWDKPVFAQPAYVEAQVWSDEIVMRYRQEWESKVGKNGNV